MALANQEAQRFNSEYIDTEHILLGLIKEGSGVGAAVLKNLNVDMAKLRSDVEKLMIPGQDIVYMGKLPHTPLAKNVIENAIAGARSLGHNYVGSEHILLGLMYETKGSVAAQVLKDQKLTYEQVRTEIVNLLSGGIRDDDEEKFVTFSFERFTDRARKVMALANQEAQRFNHGYIGTEHILLGLVKEGSGVGATVLRNFNLDIKKIRLEVEKYVQSGPKMVTHPLPHTPLAKKAIEYAFEEAKALKHNYIGTEHLMLGLMHENEGSIALVILKNLGIKLDEVRSEILKLMGGGVRDDEEEKFVRLPLERFTDRARKVMALANQEAQRFNHEYIGTEHILLGLIKEGGGVGATVLRNFNLDIRKIHLEVEKYVQSGPKMVTTDRLPESPRAKKAIEYAFEEAKALNHNYVGTEHLMLGLLHENEGSIALVILKNLGIKLDEVRSEILKLLTKGCDPNEVRPTTLYSNRASKVIESARREAKRDKKKFIDSRHILLGIISEGDVGTLVLRNLKVDLDVLHLEVRRLIIEGPDKYPVQEDVAEKIVKLAIEEIRSLERGQIETEHLLLALLREPRCDAAELLMKHNVTYQQVRNEIIKMAGE